MKDIILLTSESIIKHIVSLVAKKNDLDLLVLEDCNSCQNSKIIICDEENKYNQQLLQFSKNIVLLTKKDISDISKYSLIIKKPFLPLSFEKSILEILSNIHTTKHQDETNNIEDKAQDLVEFLNELDETNNKEEDEILIPKEVLDKGGILDKEELTKLSQILDDEIKTISPKEENETNLDNLSAIIDNAIEELSNEEVKQKNNKYEIILKKYTFDELKPLLTKFNQEMIDKLVNGEEIE